MTRETLGYTIDLKKIQVEGQAIFEARIQELPEVAEYAETPTEAYDLAVDTIETAIEICRQDGRKMPAAHKAVDDYSGRLTLRVDKTIHWRLAKKATESEISLNHLISTVLAKHVGQLDAKEAYQSTPWFDTGIVSRALPRPAKNQDQIVVETTSIFGRERIPA